MAKHTIYMIPLSSIYPHYITKAERKIRTKDEEDVIIEWLTVYDESQLLDVYNVK